MTPDILEILRDPETSVGIDEVGDLHFRCDPRYTNGPQKLEYDAISDDPDTSVSRHPHWLVAGLFGAVLWLVIFWAGWKAWRAIW
jgi:hypothetical protein